MPGLPEDRARSSKGKRARSFFMPAQSELERRYYAVGLGKKFAGRVRQLKHEGYSVGAAKEAADEELRGELEAAERLACVRQEEREAKPRARRKKKTQRLNMRDQTEWAFEAMDDPDPQDPPSPGSMGFLRWAKANPNAFYPKVLERLLPPKSQIEKESIQGDDQGESILDLIAEVRRELGKPDESGVPGPGAEGPGREPGLPGEADPPGGGEQEPPAGAVEGVPP